jgi:hypothetical protein
MTKRITTGFDKDNLLAIAKLWEEEYYQTRKTDLWEAYLDIMGSFGKTWDDIPEKDNLRLHLIVLDKNRTADAEWAADAADPAEVAHWAA